MVLAVAGDASREAFVALGAPGLLAVAFLEFFLVPVPPDLVLVPLAVARPGMAFAYAAIATAGSVGAGLVGHAVGVVGGRAALDRFGGDRVERARPLVERHGFAAVALLAFAPVPEGYEVASVSSGVLGLEARVYLAASVLGRGSRYALEAGLAVAVGDAVAGVGEVEWYALLAGATVLVSGALLARRLVRRRSSAGE